MTALRDHSPPLDIYSIPQQDQERELDNIHVSVERMDALLHRADYLLYDKPIPTERHLNLGNKPKSRPRVATGNGGPHAAQPTITAPYLGNKMPFVRRSTGRVETNLHKRKTPNSIAHSKPWGQGVKKGNYPHHHGGGGRVVDDDDDELLDISLEDLRHKIHEELREYYQKKLAKHSVELRSRGLTHRLSEKKPFAHKRANGGSCGATLL